MLVLQTGKAELLTGTDGEEKRLEGGSLKKICTSKMKTVRCGEGKNSTSSNAREWVGHMPIQTGPFPFESQSHFHADQLM